MSDDNRSIIEEIRFVKALQSKDTKAYSIFYSHYASALNGIIAGIVKDDVIREKIFTELLCDIWTDIGSYKPENQRLFSWMVRKARLRARSAKVKYKLNTNLKTELTYIHVSNTKGKIVDENAKGFTEDLTKNEFRIFDLVYYKGMTAEKVAEDQNLNIEDVRIIIRKVVVRARNTFKI